ncbi:putative bifunctional UDP-N-acetylglucosamine transferase and deubiquitinase ALG13 isoform X2 [Acipenser ruthenus]|uniref:putative bifunctional UDP-N-acetylglucosamine transferase and deubiquitinase ALG13 isoform X2 n=1 Tax=Acipenser ruthenus TaxID=7906 RepID=UPI00274086B9|nr:putative bifunctional UDP-N-acetylglucosamine transferase and deubiquitinase ALG13 isoform X2 [Acipenser ruthenus]
MQKGWKKYFGQKPLSEVNMDEYLASLGLYRKITARDASCLFRAVSEQLYYSQNYHQHIRKACVSFMRANRCNFEPFVEGSFEKYLERLEDPKETAGQVEIKALSLMYKRRFIVYRHPGKPPTEVADEDYKEKVVLCCSNNGHYDNVYPKHYPADAAVCQAVLYEVLYKDVFGIEEEEIHCALDVFHGSGGRRYRNSSSMCSEDANFETSDEKNHKSPTANKKSALDKEDWEVTEGGNPSEEKSKSGPEEQKPADGPAKTSFPYKVLKALDPDIYRNVEFDVWHDSRKELQKTDYMVFAGRQYCLGDKCQVRLEPGGKYYNAFIQEVGHHSSAVTVFIEELGEKHLVPLTNLKPVTQVNPVPAWNSAPNRKGGNYNRMSDGYAAELDHDVRGRRRFYKKARGKEMFMAVAYSRGQSGLPPRLQHNIPSGRSSPIHNPPGSTNMAPYEQYRPHPSSQRAGRGYGPPRSSARFVNRHHLVGPEVAYYSSPGRRYYQSFDNYSYRSRRSRQQMPCVNKECQFTFVPDNGEEPQGLDGTITFYELEEGDETAFPPLPGQGVSPPLAPPPATFWLRREPSPSGKQAMASSEEDMDERSNSGEYPEDYIYTDPEAGFQSPSVYAAAESTTNLSIQEGGTHAGSPQDAVATYSYSQQVLVNSSVNSLSCVNAASATVFTSGSTASSQSPAAPPQSTVQPVIVSPHPVTRPVVLTPLSVSYPPGAPLFVNELGEPVSAPPPPPPYSCDPNGNDLPRDYKVVQYYFNMGVQWYHQSYWNPMVQMQQMYQQSPTEQYQGFSMAQPMTEQSLQQQYTDAGRSNDNRGLPESPPNGSAPNVEAAPVSQGAVYYPVMTEHFNQQPLPTYEPCIPMVPAYHYVAPWPPVNQPRIHGTLCPTTVHQVNYVGSPTPPAYYIPQNM